MIGGWEERYDRLCGKLDDLTRALNDFPRSDQEHSVQYREWEPFVLVDAATLDGSGNGTIGGSGDTALVPAGRGWEARLHYISLTVGGDSHAATYAAFNGSNDPLNLIDTVGALVGATPSRYVKEFTSGHYFRDAAHLTVVVASGVAEQQAIVRIEGYRRQV